eukprot:3830476-Pyramimonas_sp.AAC.1
MRTWFKGWFYQPKSSEIPATPPAPTPLPYLTRLQKLPDQSQPLDRNIPRRRTSHSLSIGIYQPFESYLGALKPFLQTVVTVVDRRKHSFLQRCY